MPQQFTERENRTIENTVLLRAALKAVDALNTGSSNTECGVSHHERISVAGSLSSALERANNIMRNGEGK